LFVCLFAQQADAEWYLGGQIGGALPTTVTRADVRSATLPSGTTFSNEELENLVMIGGKAGYWFTKLDYEWLGLETNLQYANPGIAAQSIRTNLPTGFVFTAPAACVGRTSCAVPSNGADLRVLTWAPFIDKSTLSEWSLAGLRRHRAWTFLCEDEVPSKGVEIGEGGVAFQVKTKTTGHQARPGQEAPP
jgi:hypothetical protein